MTGKAKNNENLDKLFSECMYMIRYYTFEDQSLQSLATKDLHHQPHHLHNSALGKLFPTLR